MKGAVWNVSATCFYFAFLALFGTPKAVCAQGLEVEAGHIRILAEAGDSDRALRHYESLLQDKMESWQRAVIQYNIGTVLLREGKVGEALAQYKAISVEGTANPLLFQRLYANIALAKLMRAEASLSMLQSKKELSSAEFVFTITALRDSLNAISRAETAACELSNAEGGQICEPLPEIDEMRMEAKRLLANLLEQYFNFKLEHLSLQERSASLLIGLDALVENVDFLQSLPDSQSYKPQYEALFLMQAQGWDPVWSGFEEEMYKQGHESVASAYRTARRDFMDGVRLLRKGDIGGSKIAFDHSKAAVEELVRLVFGHADLKDSVQQLQVLYELVLVKEPLQERGLNVLARTQKQLQPLVEAQGTGALKGLYAAAVQDLDTGRQAVMDLQFLQGRMFVLAAQDAVKMMQGEISPEKDSPAALLEQAVQSESLALQTNILKQSAEGREPPLEGSDSLLLRLQQRVFPLAERFFGAATALQVKQFRALAPAEGADLRCQATPWDSVIPLVVQGIKDAERAKAALADSIPQLNRAVDWQALAIKKWQEALMELKAPKKPRKKEKQQDNKQQKEEKKQQEGGAGKEQQPSGAGGAAQQKTAAGRADLNSVLRLLQEMENDDRSKPKKIPVHEGRGGQNGIQAEQRPW